MSNYKEKIKKLLIICYLFMFAFNFMPSTFLTASAVENKKSEVEEQTDLQSGSEKSDSDVANDGLTEKNKSKDNNKESEDNDLKAEKNLVRTPQRNNNSEDISLGNDWKLSDFIYDKNKVIGFSESGLEKVKTQTDLILPHINPNDGTAVDTVGINDEDAFSFRNRKLTSVSDYNGNIKVIEGEGSNWALGYRSKGVFAYNAISTLNAVNIEKIGSYAFQQNKFTKLQFSKLKYIGSHVFARNDIHEMNENDLPKLEEIGDVTFYGNKMVKVHIPSVKTIGVGAFWNNEITDVKCDNVERLKDSAFINNKLTQVTPNEFPKLKYVEYGAFNGNPTIKVVDLPSVITLEQAFKNIDCEVKDNFQNLEVIGASALSYKNITELNMPKIKEINNGAFLGNPGVDDTKYEGKFAGSVIIWTNQNDVPSRENYLINPTIDEVSDGDYEEKDFIFDTEDPSRVMGFSGIGRMKFRKKLHDGNANIVLPDRIKIVGPSAFKDMEITEVRGNNVEIVEDAAFWGNKLTDINSSFPKLTETRGEFAFGKNKLTNLNIPTLKIVSDNTFVSNELTEVTLENAKEIGALAFDGNRKLKKVTFPSVETIGELCFGRASQGSPIEELNAPKVRKIGKGAFMNHNLKEVSLPNAEEIGLAAFSTPYSRSASIGGKWYDNFKEGKITGYKESTIQKLYLPKVKKIEALAFAGNKINDINIENVEVIERRAFEKNQIKDLDLPTVKSIGVAAFRSNHIEEVRANKNCEELHETAFDINGHVTRVLLTDYENPNNLQDGYVSGTRRHVVNPTKVTVKYQDENGKELQKGFTEYILAPKTYDAVVFFGYKVDAQTKKVEDNRKQNEVIFVYKEREKVENTGGIELRQENEPAGNTGGIQERYEIGSNMNTKVYFDLTGPDKSYSDGVIKIYYDNRYIDDKTIKVTKEGAAQIKSWKAHNGVIEVKMGKISGGYQLRFNIDWKFSKYVTPNNHRMEINTQFESSDKILCTSKPIYLEAFYRKGYLTKSSPLNLPNYDYGSKSSSSNGPRYMGVLGKYKTPENTYEYKVVKADPVKYNFSAPSVDRNISGFTLTDTLPTYDAVKEDGTIEQRTAVFDQELNPSWSLSEDGKTVVQNKNFEGRRYISIDPLYLSFPDLKSGANVNNKAEISMTPDNKGANESDITDSDDLSIYTHFYQNVTYQGDVRFMKEVTKPRYSQGNYQAYILDIKEDKQKVIPFILRTSSIATSTDLVDVTLTDYDLDSRLYYYGISFPLDSHTAGGVEINVIAYKKQGTKMDPAKDTKIYEEKVKAREANKVIFPEDKAKDIDYIQLVLPKDHKVYSAIEISVDTKLRNPEEALYSKTKPNVMRNYGLLSGNLYHKDTKDPASKREDPILDKKGVAISKYSDEWDNIPGNYMWHEKAEVQIRDYNEGIKFWKTQTYSDSIPVNPGDEGTYHLSLHPMRWSNNGGSEYIKELNTSFKNLELIDLMPRGVEPTKITLEDGFAKSGGKYEIINNYKETGRQAIIFKAKKLPKGVYRIAKIDSKVTEKAPEGFIKNEAFITFEEEGNGKKVSRLGYGGTPPKDDSGRSWLYDYTSMRIVKAREMFARKYIRNAGDLAWSEEGITTKSEGEFEYKLSLVNNMMDERTNVSVVDFFPYVGDTSIQEENIGNKVRPARGSQFENSYDLTKKIKIFDEIGKDVTSDYTISYWNSDSTINYNDKSADDVIAGLKWSDKPAKNTRGVKITANQGVTIKGDGSIDVIIPMKAPKNDIDKDFSLTGKKAWNTYVRKDDQTIRYVEPNKVFNEMESPLGSIEFTKFGKMGVTSPDDEIKPLAGAEFELVRIDKNDNGEVVENVVAKAKSSDNGKVKFSDIDVLKTYKIREIETEDIKTGEHIGKYKKSEAVYEISYKDFKKQHDKTGNFDIKIDDKDAQEIFLNTKMLYGKVKLEKVDAKGNPMKNMRFQIEGISETNKAVKKDAYTNEAGKLGFDNLPEGKYRLREMPITAGTKVDHETSYVPIEPKEFVIDKNHLSIEFTGEKHIVNDKVQLLIYKVGVKAISDIPTQEELYKYKSEDKVKLKGFKFKITEVDNPQNVITSELTGDDGAVIVKGLKPDTLYEISEVDTKDSNYKNNPIKYQFKITAGTKIVDPQGNEFIQSSITFANAERDKVGKIIIKKVDDFGKTLEGAEFKLYKKDNAGDIGDEIDSKITGEDGLVTFDKLALGKYVIKETKAPDNHQMIDEDIEISLEKPEQIIEKTIENPELTEVRGEKIWVDNDNKDNKRPKQIVVHLLKDGKEIDSKVVTEADGWKWNFDNLKKYENKKMIQYSVTEDKVENYTTKVNGYNIVNTYNPPENPSTPRTGDGSNLALMGMALILSISLFGFIKRKHE